MKNDEKKHKFSLMRIIGWIFFFAGILVFLTNILSYIGWKLEESKYTKEYVYSDSGLLYYENNGDNIPIKKIFNTDHEIIELDVPDKNTVIMYCKKNKANECIYIDLNNSVDQSMLSPISGIFSSLFLLSLAVFVLAQSTSPKSNEEGNNKKYSLSSIYLFYVFLLIMGIGIIGFQIYKVIIFNTLKNSGNVTTATIYSEIYNSDSDSDSYKPVSYYFVDDVKYIYVSDFYEKGNLDDNLGNTFELYYDKNNPMKASRKIDPISILILFIGIGLIAISFPPIFFTEMFEKRIALAASKQDN